MSYAFSVENLTTIETPDHEAFGSASCALEREAVDFARRSTNYKLHSDTRAQAIMHARELQTAGEWLNALAWQLDGQVTPSRQQIDAALGVLNRESLRMRADARSFAEGEKLELVIGYLREVTRLIEAREQEARRRIDALIYHFEDEVEDECVHTLGQCESCWDGYQ